MTNSITRTDIDYKYDVVVYNDDINSFEHVILTLIYCCGHTPIQAEQCANLIHFVGKTTVKKSNDLNDVIEIKSFLTSEGLLSDIIKNNE